MPKPDPADVPHSQESRRGFGYLLTHNAMPGLCKVGATRKHPIQRATELSAGTGVPGMFNVTYHAQCVDCFALEKLCHERFAEYRVDEAREFFRVPVGEVVAYIREVMGDLIVEGGEWIEQGMGRPSMAEELPWSTLFASFPDDGSPRELTPEEQAQCRALGMHQ